MQIETTTVEQDIRKFLTDEFLSGNGEILNEDVPLLGNVIDSQGVIELVTLYSAEIQYRNSGRRCDDGELGLS